MIEVKTTIQVEGSFSEKKWIELDKFNQYLIELKEKFGTSRGFYELQKELEELL